MGRSSYQQLCDLEIWRRFLFVAYSSNFADRLVVLPLPYIIYIAIYHGRYILGLGGALILNHEEHRRSCSIAYQSSNFGIEASLLLNYVTCLIKMLIRLPCSVFVAFRSLCFYRLHTTEPTQNDRSHVCFLFNLSVLILFSRLGISSLSLVLYFVVYL